MEKGKEEETAHSMDIAPYIGGYNNNWKHLRMALGCGLEMFGEGRDGAGCNQEFRSVR